MTDLITATSCAPFSVALAVMLGITALEVVMVATGFSVNDLVDELVAANVDLDGAGAVDAVDAVDAPTGMEATGGDVDGPSAVGRFLAWLYVGRVPILMILIVFLTIFGLGGLVLQGIVRAISGGLAPAVVAAPVMLVASLPVVRGCVGLLARVLPRDESSAVTPESFIGRTAVVVGGTAMRGSPAQARLNDEFGTTHYVLVEPEETEERIASGEVVLLVRRVSGATFAAIRNPNPALVDAT